MGQGTTQNFWSPGNEGVRVTVVRTEGREPVTRPIDLTNKQPAIVYSFGKCARSPIITGRHWQSIRPHMSISIPHRPCRGSSVPKVLDRQILRKLKAILQMNRLFAALPGLREWILIR